jgi:prepilin-type N-terminal cleavage/methylation domain-containing protein
MMKRLKNFHGFSLGELMIVVVLISLLALVALMTYQHQVAKANDAKRKEDLAKFKIGFEDYFNDNGCYPTEEQWLAYECDSKDFAPYLEKYLCDPVTNERYYYLKIVDGESPEVCAGYRLFAKLQNNSGDPDIRNVGCWPVGQGGCGEGDLLSYNYGVAIGVSLVDPNYVPAVPTGGASSASGASGASGPTGYAPGTLVTICDTDCRCNQTLIESADLKECFAFSSSSECLAAGCRMTEAPPSCTIGSKICQH